MATEIPLRSIPRSRKPYVARWPGGPSGADAWADAFWQAQAEEAGRQDELQPLFDAHEASVAGSPGGRERFLAEAGARGLDGPLLHDQNVPVWDLPTCSLDDLVRMAADYWPAVGSEGVELVLGPASLFPDRQRRRIAIAGSCFLWAHRRWPSVFTAWCRSKPRPDEQDRARVRTVALAPWALWGVEHRGGELFLHDRTGLGPAYVPDGPVRIIGEEPTGEGLAARVLRTDEGWVAHTALSVPVLPSAEQVATWIHDEMILARTFRPEIRLEPLLRHRVTLVRRVL